MKSILLLLSLATVICALINGPAAHADQRKCPGLRALNGQCANQQTVEDAQLRAMVVTTVRTSYLGTPIGTIGGPFIPFERLFQDNPAVFGLPTYTIFSRDLSVNTGRFIRTK